MCDRRRALSATAALALVLAAAVGAPRPVAGQATGASEREEVLVRRVHDLQAAYVAAKAAAERADARLREQLDLQDTVAVGPLRIVTTRSQIEEARALWEAEWKRFEPIVGGQAGSLGATVFVYNRRIERFPFAVTGPTIETVEHRRPATDATVARSIRSAIGGAARRALPEAIQGWTGNLPLGATVRPERFYELFVSTPTALAVACARGSTSACWTAFGEMDDDADPASIWYTAAERRALVRMEDDLPGAVYDCRDRGPDGACRMIAATNSIPRTAMPYPPAVRASLLWFALERGGAASLDRLTASIQSELAGREPLLDPRDESELMTTPLHPAVRHIREHLGRAAGMDPDALMDAWRSQVLAGAPGPQTPERSERTGVFLWVTLFAALATRSTRWRLG
jgi:hypothetical protein